MRLRPEGTYNAKKVLEHIFNTFDMRGKKGKELGRQEEKVRKHVLREFPKLGRAPKVKENRADIVYL